MSEIVKPGCEECGFTGYLHMGDPFEIEKCDNCEFYKNDSAAALAHEAVGCCDWPAVDYQSAIVSWADFRMVGAPIEFQMRMGHLRTTISHRKKLIENIPLLCMQTGTLIRDIALYPKDGDWVEDALRGLRGVSGLLVEIMAMKALGEWKEHFLWNPETDGEHDSEGKWRARRRA